MSFDDDPNESVTLSAADFQKMCDEIKRLKILLIDTQEKIEGQENIFYRKGYLKALRDLNLKVTSVVTELIDDINMWGIK